MALQCKCGTPISEDRIKAVMDISGTEPITCVKCSTVKKKKTFMSFFHKTAGDVVVIPQNAEAERQAERCYRRAR